MISGLEEFFITQAWENQEIRSAIEGSSIAIDFDTVGVKKMGYEFCIEKKLIEFI